MKFSSLCAALLALGLYARAEEPKIPATKIDDVIFSEKIWETKLEDIEKSTKPAEESRERNGRTFVVKPKGMEWLSAEHNDLRADPGNYQMLGKRVGEVVIRGRDGLAMDATVSIYNRGDDGEITLPIFESRLKEWKQMLDSKLAVRSEARNQQGAVALEGWMWRKGDTAVLLEGSVRRSEKRPEFIRLRLASISAAKNAPTRMARRDSFAANVKKDDKGFTWIEGIPMVDQGQKGYCVVASIERVARYFGADVDQHEMAQLANTSDSGTRGDEMEKAFQRMTGKIHLRTLKHIEYDERQLDKDIRNYNTAARKVGARTFNYDPDEWNISPTMFWSTLHKETFRDVKRGQPRHAHFTRKIKEYVDQGIPLCWTLYLGMFPEKGLPQSFGGHMRLVIGYNFTSSDPSEHMIYYTDSWGKGHEKKAMRADEAFCMTMALYSMVPSR